MTPTFTRFFTLRRTLLVGTCALLLGLSAACDLDDENGPADVVADTTPTNPTSATTGFNGDSFDNTQITVAQGATVTWSNDSGDTDMMINVPDLNFTSPTVAPGGSTNFTFSTPGNYSFTEINTGAGGRVIVE